MESIDNDTVERIDTFLRNFQNPAIWLHGQKHPEVWRILRGQYIELGGMLPPEIAVGLPSYNRAFNPGFPGCLSLKETIDRVEQVERDWREFIIAEIAGRRETAEKPPRKRRRKTEKKLLPLTAKESEAMHLVGEHKGNITAAAKAAGKSRTAMKNLYQKGNAKLGKKAVQKVTTKALPTDSHEQSTIHDPNGPRPPRGRVTRKSIERD